jgi:hypothetical protein
MSPLKANKSYRHNLMNSYRKGHQKLSSSFLMMIREKSRNTSSLYPRRSKPLLKDLLLKVQQKLNPKRTFRFTV